MAIYGILVILGNKEIEHVEKKKSISKILSVVFSISIFCIMKYFYTGIMNAKK